MKEDHAAARIRKELAQAGVSSYGLLKGEARRLPSIIHEKEHIYGAVVGRYEKRSSMLVATDLRVLHIDWSPLFLNTDEVTYDVVAGVSFGKQGLTNTLTLHTRLGDYTLHLVNASSARTFIAYIEKRRLEGDQEAGVVRPVSSEKPEERGIDRLSRKARHFLQEHQLTTLSTSNKRGSVSGAAVYYTIDERDTILFVTKEGTTKAHNILQHPQVSLTVTDEPNLITLQIDGEAQVETDVTRRQDAFNAIIKARQYAHEKKLPPVTDLNAGAFVVFRITPVDVRLSTFGKD